MRGHVVRPFRGMPVKLGIFRHQARKEIGEVGHDIGIGVLLNHQRGRRVLAEDGQEPGPRLLLPHPGFDLAGELVQALAAGRRCEADE